MSALGFFNGVIRSNVALAFVLLYDTVLKLILIRVLMVCSRALVIVDHLHFQYNGQGIAKAIASPNDDISELVSQVFPTAANTFLSVVTVIRGVNQLKPPTILEIAIFTYPNPKEPKQNSFFCNLFSNMVGYSELWIAMALIN
ncbi:hypothetical protein WN943_009130 [Citrus x changshan-huyou]